MNARNNDVNDAYMFPTSYYKDFQDYTEASSKSTNDSVYFGSRYHLKKYYADIDKDGESSQYIGCVLYPERKTRNDDWSYEKNMAFWAGIIDSKRSLQLLTNIKQYPNKRNEVSGTVSEICWLVDNNYTLNAHASNPDITIFSAPSIPKDSTAITDYRKHNDNTVLDKFSHIRNHFLEEKMTNQSINNNVSSNYHPERSCKPDRNSSYSRNRNDTNFSYYSQKQSASFMERNSTRYGNNKYEKQVEKSIDIQKYSRSGNVTEKSRYRDEYSSSERFWSNSRDRRQPDNTDNNSNKRKNDFESDQIVRRVKR